MAGLAYVNGRYLPLRHAQIGLEDRGNQFADGVYEVMKVLRGAPLDQERHLDRLERSLAALRIPMPTSRRALVAILRELLTRSGLREAMIYMQISRGLAPRNHPFPKAARPSLSMTVRALRRPAAREQSEGVAVLTRPDHRWGRCDIKSISLLPNILARQEAAERGCREAWLIDAHGVVTEGSSSNAYIVDAAGRLRTHPEGPAILAGVTRHVLLDLARADGIEVVEQPFTLDDARAAEEAALSSTTSMLLPVVRVDDHVVGEGRPGPVIRRLMTLYARHLDPQRSSG